MESTVWRDSSEHGFLSEMENNDVTLIAMKFHT